MEIKCNFNPYYQTDYVKPQFGGRVNFCGVVPKVQAGKDMFIKRPVADKNANGLLGHVRKYFKNYVKNIKHTYDHKVVFSLVERELFGQNTIDSITHDLDKMVLYVLGFPKSFVSEFHRKHSVHHPESGKKPNLRSMLCDNIASSPEFKPEKKYSLREHYKNSKLLQNVDGFGEVLKRYNFGENLDFNKIKAIKAHEHSGFKVATRSLLFFI